MGSLRGCEGITVKIPFGFWISARAQHTLKKPTQTHRVAASLAWQFGESRIQSCLSKRVGRSHCCEVRGGSCVCPQSSCPASAQVPGQSRLSGNIFLEKDLAHEWPVKGKMAGEGGEGLNSNRSSGHLSPRSLIPTGLEWIQEVPASWGPAWQHRVAGYIAVFPLPPSYGPCTPGGQGWGQCSLLCL